MPRDPDEPSIVSAYGLPSLAITNEEGVIISETARVDERYIIDEMGPFVLAPGETLDVLGSIKERGELIYIKVLTDNAYAATLLEVDEYRNGENGETPAHLIYNQRTERIDGQFYAIDGNPALGYALEYSPRVPEKYTYKLRLKIRNNIENSSNPFGFTLNEVAKGGLPTAVVPAYIGGGVFTHSAMAGANLDTLANAMSRPHGGVKYTTDSVFNEAVFTRNLDLGLYTPYEGIAAKPVFRRNKGSLTVHGPTTGDSKGRGPARGAQIVAGKTLLTAEDNTNDLGSGGGGITGTTVTMNTDPALLATYPGSVDNPSVMITDFHDQAGVAGGLTVPLDFAIGDRVFVRRHEQVWFLGKIMTTPGSGGDGDHQIRTSPGLNPAFVPGETALDVNSETQCFGTVATHAEVRPNILVKKVIVKRKRTHAL
jgi:hypothetical protein